MKMYHHKLIALRDATILTIFHIHTGFISFGLPCVHPFLFLPFSFVSYSLQYNHTLVSHPSVILFSLHFLFISNLPEICNEHWELPLISSIASPHSGPSMKLLCQGFFPRRNSKLRFTSQLC